MNKQFLKNYIVLFFLILNCISYSQNLHALSDYDSDDINKTLSSLSNSTINWTCGLSSFVAFVGISNYITTNYLIQEEHLVVTKYPHAQAWYDAMAEKYPEAHLHEKKFLQTMRKISPKAIAWCSTFNHIYFPQESLKAIDSFFKKQSDGFDLSDDEKLTLAREEFILLHEAGHIEHGDIVTRFGSVIASIIGLNGLKLCALYAYSQDQKNSTQLCILNESFNILNIYTYIIGMIYLSRTHEFAADKFAYTHGDDKSLEGGISFFASEEIDSLFDIENKKISPFVPVDSTFGTFMQKWAKFDDEAELVQKKFIASVPAFRWIYDFINGSSHPGPSVRVKNIEKEIERRSKQ